MTFSVKNELKGVNVFWFCFACEWPIENINGSNHTIGWKINVPKEKLDFFRALCNEVGVTPTLVEE